MEGTSPRKLFYKRWWFISIVVIVLFLIVVSSVGSETTLTPEDRQAFKESVQEYNYQDIERNPDNYKEKPAVFTGKVIQVSEGSFGVTVFRVATKGENNNIVYVTHKKQENEARILEDDIITIYGVLDGVTTYESVLGHEITLPSIRAKFIEVKA